MKALIDIEETDFKDDDILVYDKGAWRAVSKTAFLAEVYKTMVDQKERIDEMNNAIEQLQSSVAKLAKIIKENL